MENADPLAGLPTEHEGMPITYEQQGDGRWHARIAHPWLWPNHYGSNDDHGSDGYGSTPAEALLQAGISLLFKERMGRVRRLRVGRWSIKLLTRP